MTARVSFEVDRRDVERVRRKLQQASGQPLLKRMQRGTLVAGDLLARRIQAEAPRRTGDLRRSVKARPMRERGLVSHARTVGVLVGPTHPKGAHRHLVIRGTGNRPSVSRRSSNPWRVLPGRASVGETTRRGSALMGVNVRRAGFSTGRMRANPFVDRAAKGFGRRAADLVMREWAAALR